MKIKIICVQENYSQYKKMLEKSGFEVSTNADLVFKEENYSQDTFIGELEGEYEIIHYSKIIFVESFGHNIVLHTKTSSFNIREKLYQVEGLLQDKGFLRINKSTIVSKAGIKKIKPSINGRFDLILKTNHTVYVSKNYNKQFKEFIGF